MIQFLQKPIIKWVFKTSYYLIIILFLIYFYICKSSNSAPFIYNEF
ncbi:teichoic acid D-Ala incorporation-associated protein DltX [Gottfriedia luciferensis]